MKHFRKSSKPAYKESHVDSILYFMTKHCLGYNISCKGLEILGTAQKSLLLSGRLVKHLTFNGSELEANKCCQKDHLCTSTIQDLWNLIFKAPARLGALISILDPLRAHLHARINGNCFGVPEQALKHNRSKNAEGQVQPGMP